MIQWLEVAPLLLIVGQDIEKFVPSPWSALCPCQAGQQAHCCTLLFRVKSCLGKNPGIWSDRGPASTSSSYSRHRNLIRFIKMITMGFAWILRNSLKNASIFIENWSIKRNSEFTGWKMLILSIFTWMFQTLGREGTLCIFKTQYHELL